tara:strand:+ start:12752 stop:13342 length:591 start_codon:yes stop_codon:yes gene_type:complete
MDRLIEKELARIEAEAFKLLEESGVLPAEAVQIVLDGAGRRLAGEEVPEAKKLGLFFDVLFCVGMARAALEDDQDLTDSIPLAFVASESLGIAIGKNVAQHAIKNSTAARDAAMVASERAAADAITNLARRAAMARHAENYETAERIKAWYAENHHQFKSMDAAAQAAIKLEPVAFKTARKHIGEAAKNLPSDRKG